MQDSDSGVALAYTYIAASFTNSLPVSYILMRFKSVLVNKEVNYMNFYKTKALSLNGRIVRYTAS